MIPCNIIESILLALCTLIMIYPTILIVERITSDEEPNFFLPCRCSARPERRPSTSLVQRRPETALLYCRVWHGYQQTRCPICGSLFHAKELDQLLPGIWSSRARLVCVRVHYILLLEGTGNIRYSLNVFY